MLFKIDVSLLQTRAESVGTGVFAPLNTVHVQYRGVFVEQFKCVFVEQFKCCGKGLKEVPSICCFSALPAHYRAQEVSYSLGLL